LRWALRLWVAFALLCPPVSAVTLRIENTTGDITIRVVKADNPAVRRRSPTRPLRDSDTSVTEHPGLVIVRAAPADGAPIHIDVDLPYGFDIQARTKAGTIFYTGFLHRAHFLTESGSLKLTTPWSATRLLLRAEQEPTELILPKHHKFTRTHFEAGKKGAPPEWRLEDRLPGLKVTYSTIRVEATHPVRVELVDMPIPEDSPVKLPWQAKAIVDEILRLQKPPKRKKKPPQPKPAEERPEEAEPILSVEGMPHFTSSVRMVNLNAAVFDRNGRPLLDLGPGDFEVIEDGVPQEVTFAGPEEVPFNLALVLDLSGSTRRDRDAMKEAAKRFVGIAQPRDKVAVYALANDMFQLVSPLTNDRERLKWLIDRIPQVSGGSPLYDIIVISYAEEFLGLPADRNAMIVISDGVDNRIYGTGTASRVSFKKLREAAKGMNVLIYPVFLDPFTVAPPPEWSRRARANLKELAQATGGRLFVAQSLHDLDPVYPLVAEEMRSLYTIAYYPRNQVFDGTWRHIEVRVKRPGARVRTRDGYYAR